ncbi:MAG TPA: metal ABC transporter permease [Acidimicrobiales bacterium]|jgi:zinc/manganese transport system permease protein|nr:metal ABC transporter permease [Acidimicrobiales bacterium]
MMLAVAGTHLSWNLLDDVRQLFEFPFMVNAFRAGTIVAVVAGAIGWFMVIRRQSFAGHTLALVGFPGAAGAVWLGISAAWGFFGFCVGAALLIAWLRPQRGEGYSEESAGIGVVQAAALACGFLFVTLYKGFLNGINALLFGSFLGITNTQVVVLGVVGAAALLALAAVGRPLLFASVDPDVAAARGVPVRALSVLFLVLLGLTTAEVSQITGTLLVFALLVMPGATAQLVTARPAVGLVLTVAIGLVVTWLALAAAYFTPYPIGFYVTTFGFAGYVGAALVHRPRRRAHRREHAVPAPAPA